jgi:hypothetical protein
MELDCRQAYVFAFVPTARGSAKIPHQKFSTTCESRSSEVTYLFTEEGISRRNVRSLLLEI